MPTLLFLLPSLWLLLPALSLSTVLASFFVHFRRRFVFAFSAWFARAGYLLAVALRVGLGVPGTIHRILYGMAFVR